MMVEIVPVVIPGVPVGAVYDEFVDGRHEERVSIESTSKFMGELWIRLSNGRAFHPDEWQEAIGSGHGVFDGTGEKLEYVLRYRRVAEADPTATPSPQTELYDYPCTKCKQTATIGPDDLQPLSGQDKALCQKVGYDFTVMVKVTCPLCRTASLTPRDRIRPHAGGSGVLTKVAEPTFPYHCEQCGESSSIEESDLQRLTGAEKARCAKQGLDPSVTVRVDCPACGESALVNRVTLVHDPVQSRPSPKKRRQSKVAGPTAVGETVLVWRRIGRYFGLTLGGVVGSVVAYQGWGPSQIAMGGLGGAGVGVFAGEIVGFLIGLFAGYGVHKGWWQPAGSHGSRSPRGRFVTQCTSCGEKIPMKQESLIGQWRSCPACGASFKVNRVPR